MFRFAAIVVTETGNLALAVNHDSFSGGLSGENTRRRKRADGNRRRQAKKFAPGYFRVVPVVA
jgi:hypothetical protein